MGYKTTFQGFTDSKNGAIEGNKHYFDGWSVNKVDGKYVLEFIAAQQGGGIREVEITNEEYRLCIAKKLGFSELVKRYKL